MANVSKKVFLTTSVFVPFVNRSHQQHNQSTAFFRYFAQENYSLFVNSFTISETANQLQKEVSSSISKEFIRIIFNTNIDIIYETESDIKATVKFYSTYQSHEINFAQALIATLADRRNIGQIATLEIYQPLLGQTAFALPF